MCKRLCEILTNLFVDKKIANSFIITDKDVEILEINKNVDTENLLKYLKHHIMYTEDKFNKTYFDSPLIVKFKYQNEIYIIHLNKLECKNIDHSVIFKEPKFLSAVIKDEDITKKLQELHGPSRNFFKHILDAVSDIHLLLSNYHGKLQIFDMMGQEFIVVLS